MRSTIKREAEEVARYPKSQRPGKAGVPDIALFPLRLGASRLGASEGFTHKFENGHSLGIMSYQVAAHMKQIWHMRTSQIYRAVAFPFTRIVSIIEIRVKIRVMMQICQTGQTSSAPGYKLNRNSALILTHIVQRKGRCPRMTLHS